MDQPSTITLFGTGRMGAALGAALLSAGRDLKVWNRNPANAEALVGKGASRAGQFADAIVSSDLLLLCLSAYSDWFERTDGLEDGALTGRLVVNLTTGSPEDAARMEGQAARLGFALLDGAIMAYPIHIGTPQCSILLAGPHDTFADVSDLLGPLRGLKHVGEAIGAANAFDMALLLLNYGTVLSFMQGASLLLRSGASVPEYAAMVGEGGLGVIADTIGGVARAIAVGDHAGDQATLNVHAAGARGVLEACRRAGGPSELAEVIAVYFERSLAAGHGDKEFSAVFETLRPA